MTRAPRPGDPAYHRGMSARLAPVVRVVDFPLPGDPRALWLNASCIDQRVLCYLAPATGHARPASGDAVSVG